MVRGALVSLVLYSTLDSSAIPSTGDDNSNASKSAALTLIGPDVMAIANALENLHELWANPIEIILAIWLLSRETGAGSIGPAVAVIGALPFCQINILLVPFSSNFKQRAHLL